MFKIDGDLLWIEKRLKSFLNIRGIIIFSARVIILEIMGGIMSMRGRARGHGLVINIMNREK